MSRKNEKTKGKKVRPELKESKKHKGKDKRRWPTRHDLVAWSLFDYFKGLPPGELTPNLLSDQIKKIEDSMHNAAGCVEVHASLYEEYDDFAEEFLPHIGYDL